MRECNLSIRKKGVWQKVLELASVICLSLNMTILTKMELEIFLISSKIMPVAAI